MSQNATFYFQSNRRRGRSGDLDEGRAARPEFSTAALMGRISALDEQLGALLRGEGRAPNGLTEPLTAMQVELGGLAVALKELAHLRAGQESAQQESTALRAEIAALHEAVLSLAAGQAALQATTDRIAVRIEQTPEAPFRSQPGEIVIEPVRPRLLLGEAEAGGSESVLRLDTDS
ncbi:MAG TPA: hypothetical protein VK191_13870 [Symbiobacteriaceae bacterium]|nr:hypothetical protein [Symbiobacteriaceae bacterium]